MFRQIIILLIAVSLWAWGNNSPKPIFYSQVSVIDGDTVYVGNEKIRLAEIDAPELSQQYGRQSKLYLEQLLKDKQVEVKPKNKDRYGRQVAWLYVDGKDVSETMVKNGYAWAYMSKKQMKFYENEARYKRLGLWSCNNPIRPSEYRKARN